MSLHLGTGCVHHLRSLKEGYEILEKMMQANSILKIVPSCSACLNFERSQFDRQCLMYLVTDLSVRCRAFRMWTGDVTALDRCGQLCPFYILMHYIY